MRPNLLRRKRSKQRKQIPTKVCESVNANFRNTTSNVTVINFISKPTLVLYLHLCLSFNVMKHLSLNFIGYTCIYFEVSEDLSLTYFCYIYILMVYQYVSIWEYYCTLVFVCHTYLPWTFSIYSLWNVSIHLSWNLSINIHCGMSVYTYHGMSV